MKRKTAEEKEKIIQEIEKIGIVAGCRKNNIAVTTYYDWECKYKSYGIKGLGSYTNRTDKELKELEKENVRLKELLIEKELQVKMQQELLKKKMLQWGRKGK